MADSPRSFINLNVLEALARSARNRAKELNQVSKTAPVGEEQDWTPFYDAHDRLMQSAWDVHNYLYPPQHT